MGNWIEQRINQQRDLAAAGRAGVWLLLEGGPRNGARGFVPHLEWPFFVVIDGEGATWSFASPPGRVPIPDDAMIVGTYTYDGEHEVMRWQAAEGVTRHIPSMK